MRGHRKSWIIIHSAGTFVTTLFCPHKDGKDRRDFLSDAQSVSRTLNCACVPLI